MSVAVFDNGLHLVYEHRSSPVVYCGYLVKVGTRHEAEADSGMAHFIEHMHFKGTTKRSSKQISNYLERLGGELNAFTNKQETVYCATVLRENTAQALDLLTDIVFHSTYPQNEITKEVEVIIDEIDSYLDSPSELIFDEFEALLFQDHPLGRDILGKAECLRTYTTADAKSFVGTHYRPDNAVFYFYGNYDFKQLLRLMEKQQQSPIVQVYEQSDVACVQNEPTSTTKSSATFFADPFCEQRNKNTAQAHVVVGAPTFGGQDERRYALFLLNNILGGPGMNSRLNMSLRERHGLVYSIDAFLHTYPDVGYWNVYFGCDKKDVQRCLRLVRRELQRFVDKPLSRSQLHSAQQQLIGQISISSEDFSGYAQGLAKTYAHYGVQRNLEELKQRLLEVTVEEIQQLATEIYAADRLSILTYA